MRFVKGVERVEEFFLRPFAVGEELDVVDDQDVDLPKRRLELVHAITAERRDQLRHEGFGAEVGDPCVGIPLDRGMPEGPYITDDPHVALPPKDAAYNQMEAMIYHFKLIMDGIQVPAGEVYTMVEAPNGELGFYVVSDGGSKPYRIKVRPPCFPIFSTFPRLIQGGSVSDAIISLRKNSFFFSPVVLPTISPLSTLHSLMSPC